MGTSSYRVLVAVAAAMAVSVVASSAAASEPSHYEVVVEGMACPFCTYGLERKLEDLDGVDDVTIDLEGGRAKFDVTRDEAVTPKQIARAVDKAGFTLGRIEARLRGEVRAEGGELVIVLGGDEKLRLHGGSALGEARKRAADGPRELVVEGKAKKRGGRWTLAVEKVRAPRASGG